MSDIPEHGSGTAGVRHDTIVALTNDARQAARVIDPEAGGEGIERPMAEADERTREMLERYGGGPKPVGDCR